MNYPVPSRSYIGDSDAFVGDYIDRFTRFWNNHNQGKLVWDNVYATNASITTLLKSVAFSPTTAGIVGTTTNDSAAAGNVGEYISSFVSSVNVGTSGTYTDVTSISLTAGDWDVTVNVDWVIGGGTASAVIIGVSTTSGNSSTGLNGGDNLSAFTFASSSLANTRLALYVPAFRVSIASTTTHYLKGQTIWTVGTPQYNGARLSARRVR